jgi:hypothetical protein
VESLRKLLPPGSRVFLQSDVEVGSRFDTACGQVAVAVSTDGSRIGFALC